MRDKITPHNVFLWIAAAIGMILFLIFWLGWPAKPTLNTMPELVGLSLFFGWIGQTL